MQSQISLKENGLASFNSNDNANTFCRFFSNLADSLQQKLPPQKNKSGIKSTEVYCDFCFTEDFVLHNVDVTTVDEILKNLDVTKIS